MRRHLSITGICVLILFSLAGWVKPTGAQSPDPAQPTEPPSSAPAPSLPSASAPLSQADSAPADASTASSLIPLKAVLIVGPLEEGTQAEIANMELAAAALQSYGVQVYKFYTPNDRWADIAAAANGAHFLLYRGHGLYWNGNVNTPQVGGFEVTERMYSSDEIKRDLKLAPNAIIMIYACFATGSSTTDPGSITQAEAQRRVSQYSQPFFEMGAAGYYANWYGDAFKVFITNLFSGQTLGNAFKNYSDYEASKAVALTHQAFPNLPLWLSWETWTDYPIKPPIYNNAFVGYAEKTLADLFQPGILLSTNQITAITKPSAPARTYQVTVQSNLGASFNWAASPAGGSMPGWVSYSPASGTNGAALNITLTPPSSIGKFQTSLVVQSADGKTSQTLTITLITTSNPSYVFLPSVRK